MMFIRANGKVSYTQAKAYCPIILLSFMQKTMQNFVTRNVKEETMGHVPYIYNNLPTNHGSPHSTKYHRQQPPYNTLELLMMGIGVPKTC